MSVLKSFAAASALLGMIFGCIQGQNYVNPASVASTKNITEQKLGLDDLLVNGISYIPEHTNVNGSPEFEYINGHNSFLFIKGQKFEKIRMAYDIVSDHALLIRDFGNGLENRIILYPSNVDSFTIGNHFFVNPANSYENFTGKGYFEKITDGNIIFLKKHSKSYLQIYDNLNRGKYSPQKFSRFLTDSNGKLTAVNSKGSFLRYFSKYKKNIRSYINEHNIKYKNADHSEIRSLMNHCNTLIDERL